MGLLTRLYEKKPRKKYAWGIRQYNKAIGKKNPYNKKRVITVSEYSSYSNSDKPWYKIKETMTKKEFDKRKRNYRYKELVQSGHGKYPSASWKKKYLNELHD